MESTQGVSRQACVIRVETLPSERDQEGYPRTMAALVELPARGELPPVQLAMHAASFLRPT